MEEPRGSKRLACVACSRAKRKCNKVTPSCARCAESGFTCVYPPRRAAATYNMMFDENGAVTAVPALGEQGLYTTAPPVEMHPAQLPMSTGQLIDNGSPGVVPGLHTSLTSSGSEVTLPNCLRQSPWFLEPCSWELEYPFIFGDQGNAFIEDAHTIFIEALNSWLKQWTSEGQCPFIHHSLYALKQPECIRDAFSAATTYQSRTRATEKIALQIVNEFANRLIQSQASQVEVSPSLGLPSTTFHLARVQALIVYVSICLFDGDISSRAQAEQNLTVLTCWADLLYRNIVFNASEHGAGQQCFEPPNQLTALAEDMRPVWRAWILSESVRRTYITFVLLNGIYMSTKQGWSDRPGGLKFTGDQGLWEATSPYAWVSLLRDVEKKHQKISPVSCLQVNEIITRKKPSDFDQLTHTVLSLAYGTEMLEQWFWQHKS
ncbi:Transcription factor gsfR2 [Paramyrothecium foliicola]|nr:Transcription factor gsfR2 [Paramyrothecium foliicola]